MESFSVPGQTLLGTDSHTPLCGAAGMLAIGAGGLDVAVALGGGPYFFPMPAVVRVWLTGAAPAVGHGQGRDPRAAAPAQRPRRQRQDLRVRRARPRQLSLPQRMTIANMGAELTLTTSVFPSDEVTRSFFARLGRGDQWRPALPDDDAAYDDEIELDLGAIAPLVALPGSPDRVVPVEEVAGTPVEQVMVGSCTNGSWYDMAAVTDVLRGRRVHPSISFVLFPGSHRILRSWRGKDSSPTCSRQELRVSEPTCGACAGIGHVPAAGAKSLRAFNRNFSGRSGVKGDEVYLCSSVAAALGADRRHHRPAHGRRARAGQAPGSLRGIGGRLRALPDERAGEVLRAPTSSRCRWARRWRRRWRRRSSSSSATRSRRTTSPPPARRCWCSAPTSPPSPSSASGTSTPTSWPAPRRPGAASSWAASTTARAPRARPP